MERKGLGVGAERGGEQRMSARFQGLLLIHVGFVKNTASRLRQTEGTPHLRSALAREGLDTGNSGSLPGPPTRAWRAHSTPCGGLGVGSPVSPHLPVVWEVELLGESRRHH